jgi:hypothetical protein
MEFFKGRNVSHIPVMLVLFCHSQFQFGFGVEDSLEMREAGYRRCQISFGEAEKWNAEVNA